MVKIGILTQETVERKSNKKRYVLYPTVIKLKNGNIVQVTRIEYHRNIKKLTLHYSDDTDELKQIVEYLSRYYEYMKIYQQTGNQTAMTQAASFLLKLDNIYKGFDIMELEKYKQYIVDNYSSENDLETLIETTKLNVTLIKAILVLNGKIKLK